MRTWQQPYGLFAYVMPICFNHGTFFEMSLEFIAQLLSLCDFYLKNKIRERFNFQMIEHLESIVQEKKGTVFGQDYTGKKITKSYG